MGVSLSWLSKGFLRDAPSYSTTMKLRLNAITASTSMIWM